MTALCRHAITQLASGLLRRQLPTLSNVPSKSICHKDDLNPEVVAERELSAPWPYDRKRFTSIHQVFQTDGWFATTGRFTENTAFIDVEGNVGSNWKLFAERLSKEFGMRFFPELNIDFAYVEPCGFDLRTLNPLLPTKVQYPDLETVFRTRDSSHAANLQEIMYRLRYYNYLLAMTHMFNTGDGVVMERSPWADSVFADLMYELGFYSRQYINYYYLRRSQTISLLQRPQLVVYVDVPVKKCLENIRKKNLKYEMENVDSHFLSRIESLFKDKLLVRLEEHSELLVVKSDEAINEKNVDDLVAQAVDQISSIDFNQYFRVNNVSDKMADWREHYSEADWSERRRLYSNGKKNFLSEFKIPKFEVDELFPHGELQEMLVYVHDVHRPKYSGPYQNKSLIQQLFPLMPKIEDKDKEDWFPATKMNH